MKVIFSGAVKIENKPLNALTTIIFLVKPAFPKLKGKCYRDLVPFQNLEMFSYQQKPKNNCSVLL